MLSNCLQIKGRSLVLNDHQQGKSKKGKPRKSKRQLFNRDFFKNEETHEIANHYKDFQRRRKIRKRRRKSSVKFVKGFEEKISYREVLQIPCFIYPRFTEVFPWRGRQTICELNPPDTIYNNTIKRITFADTLKELHTLATRQTFLYKNSLNRHQQQNSINIKRGQPTTITSLTTNPISTTFLQFTKNIQELDPEREKQKTTLGCVRRREEEEILSTIKPYKNNTTTTTTIVKLCTDDELIQLASECYDEGFQSHWEYLKSIGERNALKRSRKHSTCSAASSCRSLSSSNSAESSGKYIPSLKRIVQIKRPSIKRSRRIYIRNNNNNHDDDFISHTECQIRIDITRSPSAADSQIDKSEQLSDYSNKNHKNIQHHCDSMSDYLFNDNLLASNNLPSVNGGSNFNPIKNRNVTELIDSLCGLQISDTGSLPKIILTDFSSSAHDTTIAGPSTSLSGSQSSSATGCHKHQIYKYHEFDRTLGILDEKNYRSEARPP